MGIINLIENWYKDAFVISSPLNINQKAERRDVEYIYTTLKSFFGKEYFTVKVGQDSAIEKISWLFSLLSNPSNSGSVAALNDIAKHIEYSKNLDPSIQIELENLKGNPQNLRTFFFELYIYKILDELKVFNRKKLDINGKVIEGTCEILGKEFLFECKKVFMPNIKELDIFRRLMTDFVKEGNSPKKGFGMICTIKLKRPITGEHYFLFNKKIKKYFHDFNNFKGGILNIDYVTEDQFGNFKAIGFDRASYIELKEKKNYDIFYCVFPPYETVPEMLNNYRVEIKSNFFVSESSIYKKLESVLKAAKAQHKNSHFKNKIIFIDSETFSEFNMGLFQNENMFQIEKVKAIYKKLHLADLVCVIRRHYLNGKSSVLVDTVCTEEHEEIANYLKKALTK